MKLKEVSKKHQAKLKKIKVCAFDLDGILTDCKVFWHGEEVGFNRYFNIYDGFGMKMLMKAGIKVGVITGGDSVSVKKRTSQLGVDFCYVGNEDKRDAFLDIMKRYNVAADEILYMGDELFDLPLLKKAGFSATVPNTNEEVTSIVDYVTERKSGDGAAREVMDLVRYAQGITAHVEDF
ncbi:MAG: KdsC family phosphatase [Bacteriovoracaceae bacterium]|jgi:3-deoxy-D-manno-octulosonate 8-phosphate phosphatase (KDO 8-P phosphatase)